MKSPTSVYGISYQHGISLDIEFGISNKKILIVGSNEEKEKSSNTSWYLMSSLWGIFDIFYEKSTTKAREFKQV